jgi:hypothetical protein
MKDPTLLHPNMMMVHDSSETGRSDSEKIAVVLSESSSSSYMPSAGQLNHTFKFGGLPKSKGPVTNG